MDADIVQADRLRPPRPQAAADAWPSPADSAEVSRSGRTGVVTALYQAHALSLVRLAHVVLGDAAAAEDVVQDAFCGLYRRWSGLSDPDRALQYVRSAVLNGCRTVLRQRRRHGQAGTWPDPAVTVEGTPSAEATVLDGEQARALLTAVQQLPHRQREAVVLRYYLDMPEAEIAAVMGISPGSVRSATSRALGSLGQLLENTR